MFKSRVSSEVLTHRLDCPFYHPDALKIEQQFRQYRNLQRLSEIVDTSRKITNGVRGPDLQPSNYCLVRLQDCQNWSINFDGCLTISKKQFYENRRCQLFEGDVVVAIGGYIGSASIARNVKPAVIGQHSAVLPRDPSGNLDEGYLVTYLNSAVGAIQFQRYVSGSVQPGINLEDLREIPIPIPNKSTQAYIGDKVRQAERLRERSRELEQESRDKLNAYFGYFKPFALVKSYRTQALGLENRIDAWFYNPRFLSAVQVIQEVGAKLTPLGKLAKQITNGGTPAGASFGIKGVPWIRGKDFEHGDIASETLRLMDSVSEESIKRSRLEVGDIILSIKGTVGDVSVVDELLKGFNINQDIARLQIGNLDNAHFLAVFLESPLGQVLIEQQVYGAVNAFFSLENLRLFSVPDPASVDQQFKFQLASLRHRLVLYRRLSKSLTNAAKLLVEALIEGKVTEDELKTAQEALQRGDREPDQIILSRLTCKGFDVKGELPLFPDLDALYDAIDQANSDGEEDQ